MVLCFLFLTVFLEISTTAVLDLPVIWKMDYRRNKFLFDILFLCYNFKNELCKISIGSKKNNPPTKIKIWDNQAKELVMKWHQKLWNKYLSLTGAENQIKRCSLCYHLKINTRNFISHWRDPYKKIVRARNSHCSAFKVSLISKSNDGSFLINWNSMET